MSIETQDLRALYLDDETAWLEANARLASERQVEALDLENLAEYLHDMARRDRREVVSRLTELLAHLLKWNQQPERRSRSWEVSILKQRRELHDLLDGRTLRNHALVSLDIVYDRAVAQAMVETGLGRAAFPDACPWTLDQVLRDA